AGGPLLPELEVHVLDGVDAEPVDAQVDPVLVDLHEPVHHAGILGHQVVQAVEVAVGGGLSLPGGVAAVVVERDVVEPVRTQRDVLIRHGSVGEGRAGVHVGEFAGACVFGRVGRGPVSVQVRRSGFADIVVLALGVIHHIGGVGGGDAEIDVGAACVGG